MTDKIIDKLVKAKQHELELINQFHELANECYANDDLEGHAYWTDRAFELIELYQALNRDLRKVRGIEEL